MIRTPTFKFQRGSIIQKSWLGLSAALLLTANIAHAQTPTVTALSPARNARSAPRTTNVAVGFSQTLSNNAATLGALKVFSSQAGGKKAGTVTVNGNTLSFNPSTDFKPGERVFTTVSAAAQSTGGTAATPHVFEFTTATSPSTGVLAGGSNVNLVQGVINVRLGDVDGDGDLDFISDNPLYNSVRVRLNDGSGSFSGTTEVAVGQNPNASTLADVDGDGDLDLLSANRVNSSVNPSTVSVRLNNGAGSFSGTQNVPVGSFPVDLATGDIDGDGDLDLLTVNATRTVSIWLNDGAGNFSGTQQAQVSGEAATVTVRDIDNDGDLDLLTTNSDGATQAGTVSVRLNNGSGTFSGTQEVPVLNARKLALGDIDADGDLDFVTGSPLSVLRNDGTGQFASTQQIPSASGISSSALSDMDGDSDLDLVIADNLSNTVTVRRNDGSGTFGSSQTVTVGLQPSDLAVGDVDGDGDLDVLTPSGNTISVRLNQNGSALQASSFAPARNALATARTTNVTVGFNQPLSSTAATQQALTVFSQQAGGRKAGVAAVSGSTLTVNPTTDFKPGETVFATLTTVVQSSGGVALPTPQVFQFTTATTPSAGRFGPGPDVSVSTPNSNPQGLATGDVDGDGDLDLLTANVDGTVSVRLNNGGGSFSGTQEVPVASTAAIAVVLADLDGDGDLDFATANGFGNVGTVSIRLNNGSGTFSGTTTITTGYRFNRNTHGLAVGDVDGDGDLDLVTSYSAAPAIGNDLVGTLLNDGNANFRLTQQIGTAAVPYEVALGDVDNDGDLDLLAADYSANSVLVRLNDGSGTFSGTQAVAVGNNPRSLALGDLDGDGDLDLATANFSASTIISIRLNNGSGIFSGTQTLSIPDTPFGVRLGDVDGDGDLDLAILRASASGVDVYLNNGSGSFTASQFVAVGGSPQLLAFGDLDGNGTLDLATANYNGQSVSVRLNNSGVLANASRQLTEQVSLYPNPTHASVRLLLPAELAKQRLQVRVLNSLGQVVLTQTLAAHATPELALSHLAAGLYTLQLQTNQGLITKRLLLE
ncbi:FG-GAP-like repeat-containing protein [Hymenobacter crusticola]|uniref:SbsA Ig-like domain-containing protein n=1 Tax=Hymenobacter crusticola TaxID=1770526 RepID=A0A243WD20_9BACT|nr:FG-GAP-like repeat-containing protein [Hymenobacter crusticola]OUJ73538.1 hypothetical protein BXP70_14175 [Hymenobacter crusticola]